MVVVLFVVSGLIFAQDSRYTIKYYETGIPSLIDPIYGGKIAAGRRCSSLLFRNLYGYDKNFRFVPILAASAPQPVDQTKRRYKVKLRKGVTWHDGQPITANDVVKTFQILNHNLTDYSGKNLLAQFRSVNAENDSIILFELNTSDDNPEYFMTFAILPAHKLKSIYLDKINIFTTTPIGNGPFQLSEKKSSQIVFDRYNAYIQMNPALRHTNIERVIAEQKVEDFWIQDLTNGNTDLIIDVPLNQLGTLADLQNVRYKPFPNYSLDMLGFNLSHGLLSKKFIRKAVYHALNREAVVKAFYSGRANLVTGPYPFGSYFYFGAVPEYQYDPNLAVKILQQNGCTRSGNSDIFNFHGQPLSFELLAISNTTRSMIITQFIRDLRVIGIEIKPPKYLQNDQYLEYLQNKSFEIVWFSPNYGEDLDISIHYLSDSRSNFFSFSNSKVDTLFNKLTKESGPSLQLIYGHEIHKVIHDEIPCIFLWTFEKYAGYSSKLKYFYPQPLDFFQAINDWEIEKR